MTLPRNVVYWFLCVAIFVVLTSVWACSSKSNNPVSPTPTTKELDSGNIGAGGAFQHRFFSAGTFAYHCIFHSAMTGSVTVASSAVDTVVNVSITSSSSPFPAASVKPGGRVAWTNNTAMTHTVTSN